MENEDSLPKPQADLPLPEKEIPARATPQGQALQNQKPNIFKSKFFLGFVIVSFLTVFLISGFYLSKNKQVSLIPTPNTTPKLKYVDVYVGTGENKFYTVTTPSGWYKNEYKTSTTLTNYDPAKATDKSSPEKKLKVDIYQTEGTEIQTVAERNIAESSSPFQIESRENITIDGQPAFKINYPHMFLIYSKVPYESTIAIIAIYFLYDSDKSAVNQILSTFKFTK